MQNFIGIVTEYLEKQRKVVKQYKFMVKPCLMLAAVYTIAISALIHANYSYRDDLNRVICGRKGWDNYGRYISNFLSTFIHADSYLTDVSPLPQLIAVLFMAISGVIIWYSVSGKQKFSIWDLAALIPLGISPYFLGCISFKYDSPYMALSVLVSVIPILFLKCGDIKYFCAIVIGTLMMCTTYQASSGVFPMLIILLCMKFWNQKENIKKIFKFATISVVGYFTGLLIFKLFLMPPSKRDYVSNSLPPLKKLIPETIRHLVNYFSLIKDGFKTEWLILILCMAAAFIFVMVRDSKRNKFTAACLSGITLLVMLLFSFGMYPVLLKPLFQARAMYGFGVFITLIGIVLSTSNKIYFGKCVCFVLGWCFFVFSFTYGNALEIQEAYAEFRVEAVLNELNDMDIMISNNEHKKEIKIQFSGFIGHAPAIRHMVKDNKMLEQLMPSKNHWFNGIYKFFNYYKLKNVTRNLPKESGVNFRTYNLPVLKDTMFYTIRGKDQYILIEMK